jgi:hypothetical protein
MARPMMAKEALMANCLPITLNPRKMNGMFTRIINTYKGMAEISDIKSEIPVAPPSIKLLGNKKLSKPKAAEKIPAIINRASWISAKIPTLNLLDFFQ